LSRVLQHGSLRAGYTTDMFEFEFTIGRTEPAPRMSFANAHLRIVDRFEPQCRRTRMPQKSGFSATGVP
jgi:hypothetical protein